MLDKVVELNHHKLYSTHRLISGDCINGLDKLKDKVDLLLTDPPYNLGIDYGKTFKDRMPNKKYFDYLTERLNKALDTLKIGGTAYIIAYPEICARLSASFLDFNDTLAAKEKIVLRRWITWHYPTNIGHSKKNFTRSHRAILFLTKGKKYTFNRENALLPYKNPTDKRVKKLIAKGSPGRMMYDTIFEDDIKISGFPNDILKFNLLKNVDKNRQIWHSCQLPLNMLALLIKLSSNVGDTVLDPFAGTFSTSLVAANLNRNSIGIDINPNYVKFGEKRLNLLKN